MLLRFVADKAADLSSGTLYAAKFSAQTVDAATKQPRWTVSWIKLGSSTQAALEKIVASRPKFSDIFEAAKPAGAPLTCPAGFSRANTVHSLLAVKDAAGGKFAMECLKVKPGMETAAAFLESRRFASIKGATTEFEKMVRFLFFCFFSSPFVCGPTPQSAHVAARLFNKKHCAGGHGARAALQAGARSRAWGLCVCALYVCVAGASGGGGVAARV